MSGYVYLICELDNVGKNYTPVKIGVTNGSIENRLKKLQTGNAAELHILSYYKTEEPYKLEKMLHLNYHKERGIGEWFNLTDENILDFKNICKNKEDIIKLLKKENYFYE